MYAISLHQPWASLIAAGVKQYETRSWAPPHYLIGDRIAIHAAKFQSADTREFARLVAIGSFGTDPRDRLRASFDATSTCVRPFGRIVLPFGCVVATARLAAAYRLGDITSDVTCHMVKVVGYRGADEHGEVPAIRADKWGDYSRDRWAWLLEDVRCIFTPVPVRGRQGFWMFNDAALAGATYRDGT